MVQTVEVRVFRDVKPSVYLKTLTEVVLLLSPDDSRNQSGADDVGFFKQLKAGIVTWAGAT